MKSKLILMAVAVFSLFFIASCSKKSGGDAGVSNATGWEYNNQDNGGFEVADYNEQAKGPGLVLIEGGAFTMGRVEQDVMYDWNNMQRRVTVSSFYMDETEVRNVDYREYLHWIGRVFADYPDVYQKALPDTLVWRRRLAYNEPYVEYYLRHPAYHNYPVVGVSWIQASDYCSWRTDRVNEKLLIDEGVLENDPNQAGDNNFNTDAYLARQYEGVVRKNLPSLDPNKPEGRPVRMEDGILLPKYRLPTESEWEYAAWAMVGNSVSERIYNQRLYPWNGHFVRNDSKQNRGQFRANFQRGRGDMMGIAGALNDNASIPAPVDSYWPNDFGLYCMAGNVNEWVLDVYRPLSSQDVDGFNPFRGNVFLTLERENGVPIQKDSLGRMKYRKMNDEESMNRVNYHKADNINFNDGDLRSAVLEGGDWTIEDTKGSNQVYFQGKGPKGSNMTSLINDRSRIYKGGSWRDRVYWMVPSTRRFLDERKSTDDIGFRCAMIRVGSPGGFK